MKKDPLFILGIGRAGSHLLANALTLHPEIDIIEEIHYSTPISYDFIQSVTDKFSRLDSEEEVDRLVDMMYDHKFNGNFWKDLSSVPQKGELRKEVVKDLIMKSNRSFKSIFNILISQHAKENGKTIKGAKSPVHFSRMDVLFKWFPNCKVIHLTRDPRAISTSYAKNFNRFISVFKTRFPFLRRNEKIISHILMYYAAFSYVWSVKSHNKFKNQPNYYLCKFEELIINPEKSIKQICKFLKVEYNEQMLYPNQVNSTYFNLKPSDPQLLPDEDRKKGFDKETLNRWKKHLSKLNEVLIWSITRKSAKKFGYKKLKK